MNHALTILWAQWRSVRNGYPRRGVAWTAVVALIWYVLWAGLSVVIARIFSEAENLPMIHNVLPSGLFIVFLYWQLIPLLMATTGSTLELRKLRVYPIPESQLFRLEMMLRVTSGIEMIILLAGITVGVTLNPRLPGWALFAVLAYIVFNLSIAIGLRDLLARLLSRKRIREFAFFLFVLTAALPQVLLTHGGPGSFRFLRAMGRDSWRGWPWTAAANLMQGSDIAVSILVLALWIAAALGFSRWQFSRTLKFDAAAAIASDASARPRSGLLEAFYRFPSTLLSDPLGALIEKEFRSLLRSPRFRLVFLMGFTFGLLIWLPLALGYGGYRFTPFPRTGSLPFLVRNYLTVVTVYSLLLLGEICFWNIFGFDRSAAQFYFLSPIPFSRTLIAKNLTAVFFIFLEITVVTIVCVLLGMPVDAQRLLEAYAVAAVISLFLLSAGNLHSIRNARGVNPGNSFRSGAAGRIQAMLFLLYPIAFSPVIVAYLARYAFDSEAAFFIVLAIDAVLGGVTYAIALESATRMAEVRKEEMIAALSAADGPIAD